MGYVSEDAELDHRVVGRDEHVAWLSDEALAEPRVSRHPLEVRTAAPEATGCRGERVEGRVDAPVGLDGLQERGCDSREVGRSTPGVDMLQDRSRGGVLHDSIARRAENRESTPIVYGRGDLTWRVEVDVAEHPTSALFRSCGLHGELGDERCQARAIDEEPCRFDRGRRGHDVVVELPRSGHTGTFGVGHDPIVEWQQYGGGSRGVRGPSACSQREAKVPVDLPCERALVLAIMVGVACGEGGASPEIDGVPDLDPEVA